MRRQAGLIMCARMPGAALDFAADTDNKEFLALDEVNCRLDGRDTAVVSMIGCGAWQF